VGITVAQGGLVTGRCDNRRRDVGNEQQFRAGRARQFGNHPCDFGAALATGSGGNFLSIANRAGGSIGGISGIVTTS
jgi:hypothetical protein